MAQNEDRIFTEKAEKLRFIIQHPIALWKLFEKLEERFKIEIFKGKEETIVLVEEKEEEK